MFEGIETGDTIGWVERAIWRVLEGVSTGSGIS